ncbi:MAG: hypothetical protein CMJ81_07005 [Planctomycetaceae bacterium]|nr:hypothetical protein [Planctomycetaceae bacterium]MBP61202.1 hypothetical protein [Planctomycetaceae bacterium]
MGGNFLLGSGISFSDPTISELVAETGYDFAWIDGEHGPFDLTAMLRHARPFAALTPHRSHGGRQSARFGRVSWCLDVFTL